MGYTSGEGENTPIMPGPGLLRALRRGDLTGLVEDLQLLFRVGYRVANQEQYPEWKAGTEFKSKREEMLKAVSGN